MWIGGFRAAGPIAVRVAVTVAAVGSAVLGIAVGWVLRGLGGEDAADPSPHGRGWYTSLPTARARGAQSPPPCRWTTCSATTSSGSPTSELGIIRAAESAERSRVSRPRTAGGSAWRARETGSTRRTGGSRRRRTRRGKRCSQRWLTPRWRCFRRRRRRVLQQDQGVDSGLGRPAGAMSPKPVLVGAPLVGRAAVGAGQEPDAGGEAVAGLFVADIEGPSSNVLSERILPRV